MKLSAHIYEGLLNLYASKMRSLLALLGIFIGAASVVAMLTCGELAENEALKQFKSLGTDLLAVTIKESNEDSVSTRALGGITLPQALSLTNIDKNILIAAPYTQAYNPIQFNGNEINGSILGVTAELSNVLHITMDRGRFISNLDGVNFYCVIGNLIYRQIEAIFLMDPIGHQIQLGKNVFTIVGVAKPWAESSFVYANIDSAILIPLSTSLTISKNSTISNIIMRLDPKANIDNVKNNAENYLHDFVPDSSLLFRSAKELISHMSKQTEIFTLFLGLIGGISLLVGGIGVMNIMLVSIVERKREIGVRRAVGATRKDIQYLFLVEALILSLFGGGFGAIIGLLIAFLIAFFWHWTFTLFIFPPVIGFTVSAATGIFFGFYPALKASRLDPIESLRSI